MSRHLAGKMAPPSDKQLQTLEKLGILPDAVDNAGKATKLLERLDKRKQEGITTPKQIRFLEGVVSHMLEPGSLISAKKLIEPDRGKWMADSGRHKSCGSIEEHNYA